MGNKVNDCIGALKGYIRIMYKKTNISQRKSKFPKHNPLLAFVAVACGS